MTKGKLRKWLGSHKEEIIRIGYYSAGVIIGCVAWRMGLAISRHNNYAVTDFTVSDLGKLGECLIERGSGANDKVLYWRIDLARM